MRPIIATTLGLLIGFGAGYVATDLATRQPHSDLSYHQRLQRFVQLTEEWEAVENPQAHQSAVDSFMAAYDVCMLGDGQTRSLDPETTRMFLRECGWTHRPPLAETITDALRLRATYRVSTPR